MVQDSFSKRWVVASTDISLEKFDGEYVALDIAVGRYFALSEAASVLVDALLTGVSPDSIISLNEAQRSEMTALFASLAEMALFTVGEQGPVSPDGELRDRIQSLPGAITFESHDDLADLILADPIHDTDEDYGWPVRKTND